MKPTILVVDDEPNILELLTAALGDEGYRVLTARTIDEFNRLRASDTVDLYLVDISLPDGNGFALIKELRRESDKGVIILSGRSAETDHVVGLEIGADDYITKPFRLRELCSRVNAVYRRCTRADQATHSPATQVAPRHDAEIVIDFEFDGHRLSLAARQLWAPDGSKIELTTAEFDLLVALLNRRGQVLSREQLIRIMKGRDWESYDRIVDTLVSRLRRKLRSCNTESRYIRTVHGVGYSFAA